MDLHNPEPSPEDSEHPNHAPNEEPEAPRKHYPPRMCRICLETVLPTVVPPSENLPDFLQAKPRVVYESSDPELGRLLRPCKCKGSSRYVHEGCLQAWRHADPGYGKRNYWHCPTCGFQYRLDRLKWAHWIGSTLAQLALTVVILICTVFLLGFVADPILNYYLDPVGAIYSDILEPDPVLPADETSSWVEHFAKGLASLGVLSFIKAMFALSPWNFFNTRSSVVFGNGRTTGRNRVASISWMVILVGVVTFLWTVFKGVRSWSGRTLQHAGERVMDVPLPDDEDEDDAASSTGDPQQRKKDN
ncbi:RING finger domain protein [Aspergillus terreus]|uniref:RING finger domain protein n=1 Tax=Aspergillus terreus TaxID=33178 RepID=A0A5M3Z5U0_ASPTE|nr:hypothetical protein ATETN484_0010010600 [Aspergillus terreus]GFF18156.1 RING finger domain protein [Aspergillus terreus]